MTLKFDSWVILKGEIRCWTRSGIKGLREPFWSYNHMKLKSIHKISDKIKLSHLLRTNVYPLTPKSD